MKSMTSSRSWFRLRVRSTRKLERKSWLASARYHVSVDPSAIRPGRLPLNNHSPSRHANVPERSTEYCSQITGQAYRPFAAGLAVPSDAEEELVPSGLFGATHNRPSWALMIERQIAGPIPIPADFVVN